MILLDVFSYSCMNCRRSLHFIKKLDARYGKHGLETIIIHPPEWEFEKEYPYLKSAIEKLNLSFHIVLDRKKAILNRFNVNFWPTQILIHDNKVMYTHIGEGGYVNLENIIRKRLGIGGKRVFEKEPIYTKYFTFYFGKRKGPFRNIKKEGKWKIAPDYMEGKGDISFSIKGKQVYLVAQSKNKTKVVVNGKQSIPLHKADLYAIFTSSADKRREITLTFPSPIKLYSVASE